MTRRKVSLVFAVVGLVVLMATTAQAAKSTITVFLREANTTEYQWEKKVIAQFEKENPNISVEIITEAGSADYATKLTTLWATGKPPDAWDHGGAVRTYENNGWLMDLAPLVKRDADELNLNDFFSGAWAAYRDGNKQWGIPFMSSPSYLWYNADLFDEAGLAAPPVNWDDRSWTWDRMGAAAKKLTARDSKGVIQRAGIAPIHWSYLDITYSWLWGGDWFDKNSYETGVATKSTFATPANERGYQKAIDLFFKDKVAWDNPASAPPIAFLAGKVGMAMGEGPWLVMGNLDKIKFRWGMAPNPMGTTQANMLYTDPWMISSKTKNLEGAWKFVKYITSRRMMEGYTNIGIFPGARRSAGDEYIKRMSKASGVLSLRDVAEALEGGHKYGRESLDHILVGWPKLISVVDARLPTAWANQKPVSSVLKEIDDALAPVIKRSTK